MKQSNDAILIIDDDKGVLESISKLLRRANYNCITATTSSQGIELLKQKKPLVILTDLRMDTETAGIGVLEEAKRYDSDAVVILYTAYGTIPNVVEAFKKGAFDFIEKVKTHHDILLPIERAFKFAYMQRENAYLKSRLDLTDNGEFYGAVGTSPNMKEVFEKSKRIAQTDATVMLTGETGTGKEVLARGIHYHSPRKEQSFVPVAVGSLPEHLLEAELFGHVKGAFTGATTEKPGLFEAADKGTIFLDEISEVSMDMQHKLLRVLQEKTVRRIGSLKERPVDVRILSATNKDPEVLMKAKKMREDLFYRINVIQIKLPPLRDRKEDIPVLTHHFLKHYQNSGVVKVEEIESDVLLYLKEYEWPGNVRELMGLVQRMVVLATKPVITCDDLPDYIRPTNKRVYVDTDTELDFKKAKAKIIEEFEKTYITNLLKKYNGNITKVAEAAGLNRKTIYRLVEARNIDYQRPRNDEE